MIAVYHSRDLDGFASGAIIKKKYPDAKLIGYDYGQDFPWDEIPEGSDLIMADVSLQMKDMIKLGATTNMIWIDHHISAITEFHQKLDHVPNLPFVAILDDNYSACEATWTYLFPDDTMPYAVRLLGRYDTWRQSDGDWQSETMPFQYGMRQICNSPETLPKVLLTPFKGTATLKQKEWKGYLVEITQNGKAILKYQTIQNTTNCTRNAFEIDFKGHKAICLNGGPFNSQTFDSVYDPDKHDIMMPFQFNGKLWVVSMYTTKDIDCGALAKEMGGGGHLKAAGMQLTTDEMILLGLFK